MMQPPLLPQLDGESRAKLRRSHRSPPSWLHLNRYFVRLCPVPRRV